MIVSIDIETTGLDPERHSVLEIAAVVDKGEGEVDWCQVVHCYIISEEVLGNLIALNMNKQAIQRIIKREDQFTYLDPSEVKDYFDSQLPKEQFTVAGANFANFDSRFLKKLGWLPNCFHRIMDIGNLCWNFSLDGDALPSSQECLNRVGIKGNIKHNAIDDARDVLRIIRKLK